MTISSKRGTICRQIQEALDEWDVRHERVRDTKDPQNRTITFYINILFDFDTNDVEGALEEVCSKWDMEAWWEEDDVYALRCDYD